MSNSAIIALLLVPGLICLALVLRGVLLRRSMLARLEVERPEPSRAGRPTGAVKRSRIGVNRAPLIALIVGGAAFALLLIPLGIPKEFAIAGALILGTFTYVIADIRAGRFAYRLESQLADAIDLMISSLRAGSGWSDALETAARESRRPLRPLLENALGRMRYGESAAVVLDHLAQQVQLESFWLFSLTQQVQQGVGGSIAKGLSAVGRFIRDRVEMRRMLATQSTMARVSMLFVAVLTYIIAAVIYFNNPVRFELFLSVEGGRMLAAGAMGLQALGVLWITRMSRVRD